MSSQIYTVLLAKCRNVVKYACSKWLLTLFSLPGASHIRVKPVFGLQDRSKTSYEPKQQNLQNSSTQSDTRAGTSRAPIPAFTPLSTPNTPTNIREYQPHSPAAGTAVINSSYSGFNSSEGSGSDPKIYTRSDCNQCNQYGTSVHQGINRGIQNRFTHTRI